MTFLFNTTYKIQWVCSFVNVLKYFDGHETFASAFQAAKYGDTLQRSDITLTFEPVTKLELIAEYYTITESKSFHIPFARGVKCRQRMLTPLHLVHFGPHACILLSRLFFPNFVMLTLC